VPLYEYRCADCQQVSSVVASISELKSEVSCQHCGGDAGRILSVPSVHLSKTSKLEKLDPKYDKLVDKAMRNTQNAEPDRILRKMKPFPKDG
jgi:putative FmdB family regulatory protein